MNDGIAGLVLRTFVILPLAPMTAQGFEEETTLMPSGKQKMYLKEHP